MEFSTRRVNRRWNFDAQMWFKVWPHNGLKGIDAKLRLHKGRWKFAATLQMWFKVWPHNGLKGIDAKLRLHKGRLKFAATLTSGHEATDYSHRYRNCLHEGLPRFELESQQVYSAPNRNKSNRSWTEAVECCCYFRNIEDLLADGNSFMRVEPALRSVDRVFCLDQKSIITLL